ncbi:MAG: DNA-binding protein [Candidatus Omnitrophota bacterium]
MKSIDLIANAKEYDGKIVAFEGEVVGDIMVRKEYAWLSINDGLNAIGVWIKKDLIRDILYIGNYKVKGDLVEITGKFNRACPEHGGDLDIHAQSITKINSGKNISYILDVKTIFLAVGLFFLILLIFILQ